MGRRTMWREECRPLWRSRHGRGSGGSAEQRCQVIVEDGQRLVGGAGADEDGPAKSFDYRAQVAGGMVGVAVIGEFAVVLRCV